MSKSGNGAHSGHEAHTKPTVMHQHLADGLRDTGAEWAGMLDTLQPAMSFRALPPPAHHGAQPPLELSPQPMSSEGPIDQLSLEHILQTLRRRWWIIALLAVLGAGSAFLISEVQRRQYTATASVVFQNPELNQQESGLQVVNTSPAADPVIMGTNVQLLSQQAGVAAATARAVGHGLTEKQLAASINVSQEGQTNIADVAATNPNPRVAAAIANTYVSRFIASRRIQQQASVAQALSLVERQIKALAPQQLAGNTGQALLDRAESLRILAKLQNGDAQVVRPAAVPTAPSSPKVPRNTAIGLLIGLLLGIAAAFVLQRLDRRIRTVEDLQQTYRLPLLGAIPTSKVYALRPDAAQQLDRGELEAFRLLRTYLRYFNVDRELRILLVSSAAPGDGKSTIARNLAQAAQQTGTKTLLIEADLRLPEVARHYEVPPGPGLSELLVGQASHEMAIRPIAVETRVNGSSSASTLDVLVAGHPPPNPTALLESQAMAQLFEWAAAHYELVVVDTPPLSVVADTISLLHHSDGVIVVSKLGKNVRDAAAYLRDRLVAVNAPLLGVVANGVDSGGGHEGYGYGYGYGYHENAAAITEAPV